MHGQVGATGKELNIRQQQQIADGNNNNQARSSDKRLQNLREQDIKTYKRTQSYACAMMQKCSTNDVYVHFNISGTNTTTEYQVVNKM